MLTSKIFINSIISGANNIYKNRFHINELNIFPVPDGDTGTNMALTLMEGAKLLAKFNEEEIENYSLEKISDALFKTTLKSARGNSGVILSLILKGFKEAFFNLNESAKTEDLVNALGTGTRNAYMAVSNPTEGTILTVARMAYGHACVALEEYETLGIDADKLMYVWHAAVKGAREALKKTQELLPALKKAKVVDAGGKGLCLILEGMFSVFKDDIIIDKEIDERVSQNNEFKKKIDIEEDLTFNYCTEFTLGKFVNFEFDEQLFRSHLEKIGNCVVISGDEDIIKTHVHTNFPNKALGIGLELGQLLSVKIDNLFEQKKRFQESTIERDEEEFDVFEDSKNDIDGAEKELKNVAIIAVASGKGLIEAFYDLGCDEVIIGGQTLNPSAGQIAKAAISANAKNVFMLPNNKNIILAAQQSKKIIKNINFFIIPTETIPSGLAVLMAFDRNVFNEEEVDTEDIVNELTTIGKKVKCGLVTWAQRDATFSNKQIKKQDIIGLNCGHLAHIGSDIFDVCFKLVKTMITKETKYVTLIYGSNVDLQVLFGLQERLSKKYNNIEFQILDGGSAIYYFIISIE